MLTQKFTHSGFTSSVIGHIFACVYEVQLGLCVQPSLPIFLAFFSNPCSFQDMTFYDFSKTLA